MFSIAWNRDMAVLSIHHGVRLVRIQSVERTVTLFVPWYSGICISILRKVYACPYMTNQPAKNEAT